MHSRRPFALVVGFVFGLLIPCPGPLMASPAAGSAPLDVMVSASLALLQGAVPASELERYLDQEMGTSRQGGRRFMPVAGTIRYLTDQDQSDYPYSGPVSGELGYLAAPDFGWMMSASFRSIKSQAYPTTAVQLLDLASMGLSLRADRRGVVVTTPSLLHQVIDGLSLRRERRRDSGLEFPHALDFMLLLQGSRQSQLLRPLLTDPRSPGFWSAWHALILGAADPDPELASSCLWGGTEAFKQLYGLPEWSIPMTREQWVTSNTLTSNIDRGFGVFFLQLAATKYDLRPLWEQCRFEGYQWEALRANLVHAHEINRVALRYERSPILETAWYKEYMWELPKMKLRVHMQETIDSYQRSPQTRR